MSDGSSSIDVTITGKCIVVTCKGMDRGNTDFPFQKGSFQW